MKDFKGIKEEWNYTKEFSKIRGIYMFTIHKGITPDDYKLENGSCIDPTVASIYITDETVICKCEDNARLIASAPELLSALQLLVESGFAPIKIKEIARSAIKKALGV